MVFAKVLIAFFTVSFRLSRSSSREVQITAGRKTTMVIQFVMSYRDVGNIYPQALSVGRFGLSTSREHITCINR